MAWATTVLFYLFAAVAAAGAIGVAVTRDIVRAAVWLLFALGGVAGVYFLLDAEFLAAVQLVVYVGGILVLIVFGVMLTSASPFTRFEPSRMEVLIASAIAAVLLVCLVMGIVMLPPAPPVALAAATGYPMTQLAEALMGPYLLPFELASVILLVVMIGAAYLAKGRRQPRPGEAQREGQP
jgi:NADH-quinone oxidoreductase subunit J